MVKKFVLALALMIGLASPLSAFAATDPYGGLDCSGAAKTSTICQAKGSGGADPITGQQGVLYKVTNIVAFIAGAAAILFIVFSGVKYITAQGDAQEISRAKQSIIYAAVGLVMIVISRQIISYVLSII